MPRSPSPATLTAAFAVGLSLVASATLAQTAADPALVAKGKYLATAGDCIACHTAPGGKPFAGGLGMQTPFGTIYTPNLTPDKATGIGAWSDDQFYRALHEGIGHRGEYLYPVFPFPWYTKVTKDDVLAIKAYLFSLPAENAPRKPLKFMFPFNIREALLTWRTAFFRPATFVPDPAKNDDVNRGAYLVEGLGHCGECHNHNNLLGASDWSGKLKGGEISGWYAPNITSDGKQGVGTWSTEEIVTYLHDGAAPGRGVALGPMHETVMDSLQHLTDQDLQAIAVYLKSFAKAETYKPLDANQSAVAASAGANAYLSNCASCHGVGGLGIKGVIPALAGNGTVTAAGPENVIRAVVGGLPAAGGYASMPAAGADLSDGDVAAIINYVRTAWGNAAPANAEAGAVGKLRKETRTIMSPSGTGCTPPDTTTALAKGIDQAKVRAALSGVKMPDMLQAIDALLPGIKASDPAATDDGVVNAMIVAYCPIALADNSVPVAERPALIGTFGGLVYGQLHNVELNGTPKN